MDGYVKPDEIAMMRGVLATVDFSQTLSDTEWEALSPRWAYILGKWDRKGWWDYGVTLRTGWLTPAGREALPRVIAETNRRMAKQQANVILEVEAKVKNAPSHLVAFAAYTQAREVHGLPCDTAREVMDEVARRVKE